MDTFIDHLYGMYLAMYGMYVAERMVIYSDGPGSRLFPSALQPGSAVIICGPTFVDRCHTGPGAGAAHAARHATEAHLLGPLMYRN